MSVKRILLLVAILIAVGADILFYRSARLVSRASGLSDPAARVDVLERGQKLLGLNDIVFRNLGRAAFEAAIEDLTAAGPRDVGLRRAHAALLRSLSINPLSAATHFDLAQTLEYMRLFDLPAGEKAMDEYVKSLRLAGRDSDIQAQTGTTLLSNWGSLGPEERNITRDILRSVLTVKTEERLAAVLEQWALRVQDPAFLRAVLPADPAAYRQCAQFLADRSLDRGERHHYLAAAETLELARAGEAAGAGRSDLLASRLKEAEDHDRSGLALLDGIRFYQALDPGPDPIAPAAVRDIKRALLLSIVRSRLGSVRTLEEMLPDLRAYLDSEAAGSAISDLEKSLRERGLIQAKPDASGKDLRRLAFELELVFRQNRYREVIEFGQALEGGLVMVTESVRSDYARVLEIVGDAYQKLDYLYESNRFYQKARDLSASPDLEILARMAKNYERLSDAPAVAALRAEAAKALPSRVVDLSGIPVPKGTAFKQALFLEAKESRLTIKAVPGGPTPAYVTLVLNGRVIWEDYLSGLSVSLNLTPENGANELEITPWNGPLLLSGIEVEPLDGLAQVPASEKPTPAGKKLVPVQKKAISGREGGAIDKG